MPFPCLATFCVKLFLLIFVVRTKGSKVKKRTKEEEIEKSDFGLPTSPGWSSGAFTEFDSRLRGEKVTNESK